MRSLPSTLLLHKIPSGNVTYVTHFPSREKRTASAESPDMNGTNCPDFASYRVSSPRRSVPTTNNLFPSLLGRGLEKVIAPEVSWTGVPFALPKRPLISCRAQMLPRD